MRQQHRGNQRGQTATEYALIVAVVVLGILSAISFLIPKVREGSKELGTHLEEHLKNNPATCAPTDPNC